MTSSCKSLSGSQVKNTCWLQEAFCSIEWKSEQKNHQRQQIHLSKGVRYLWTESPAITLPLINALYLSMDAVISLFQCGFVFLFYSDYEFYLYLSQDRRSPQSSVFYSLDSDLRICFQRMDGFCYQILPDWWTYVPLLTPLLILNAIHRLQQRTLNSFSMWGS